MDTFIFRTEITLDDSDPQGLTMPRVLGIWDGAGIRLIEEIPGESQIAGPQVASDRDLIAGIEIADASEFLF